MPHPNSSLWPSLAIAVIGALWGQYWIPTRWMQAHGLGPAWMSLAIAAMVLAATLPALFASRSSLKGLSLPGLVTGTLMSASFALYSVSLILTAVVTSILLFYLSPIWSTLLGVLLQGDKLRLPRVLALLLGLFGLAVTLGFEHGVPIPHQLGDWLALIAGIVWAYGSLRSYSSPDAGILGSVLSFNIGATLSASALILLLPASAAGAWPSLAVWQATLPGLAVLALLLVLPSTVALVWATQRLPAPRVGILLMTEIVAGTLSAALFANEPFGPRQIFGSMLIIAAGTVEVLGRAPKVELAGDVPT